MTLNDYQVRLTFFGGPLELLLHLVRRHELDICRVSLARITSEFRAWLDVLEFLDLDLIGDFIVTAAILLEIKSREVLPQAEDSVDEEAEEELAGSDLIQQLLHYKQYKNAARQLDERAAEWLEHYPRLSDDRPATRKTRTPDRIREVEIWDLVSALARIVRMPDIERETTIRMDETPISVHQSRIRERLKMEERVAFSSFFDGEKLQARIVGIFQAILELIRHEQFRCDQPQVNGEIWIMPPVESSATPSTDAA